MRRLLSSTAGALFNLEIQYVFVRIVLNKFTNVKPSEYVIVLKLHKGDSEAMFFMNGAHYFDLLQNQELQMPKIDTILQ